MEKQKIVIIIADYSKSPGPRYCYQGDDSGEDFYHKILNEKFKDAFEQKVELEVNLDGPDGYASSFLDEAFGNLVFDFGLENVQGLVRIISQEEPEWIEMIENETYKQWEQRRKENKIPRKTANHNQWYRFVINSIERKQWINKS
ncbi:STAS-like domain-containing protein [Bacteroidales bacterium OttesenSCG-928-C19]|nr:STAS-like domain-containing protein [Bacteroidales bacterium OttesenSCG-928-C19]